MNTMHVFDQMTFAYDANNAGQLIATPVRYQKGAGNNMLQNHCLNELETSKGQLLVSNSIMQDQLSCRANTNNAGNMYTWSTLTSGGTRTSGDEENSICARGWRLSTLNKTHNRSFYHLMNMIYNITEDKDNVDVKKLPVSFVGAGYVSDDGVMSARGTMGFYLTATGAGGLNIYEFFFSNETVNYMAGYYKYIGMSARCVNR